MARQDGLVVAARLDRLPASRTVWFFVVLISFGAFFEIYDIGLTAVVSPGLIKAGVFHKGAMGLLGLNDQASFVAATFLGLWLGSLAFSRIADRVGRKPIFAVSLIWYAAASALMSFQSTAAAVDAWRFVAGLGIGMQIVAIDCYLAELAPRAIRGRAFAVSTFIQFLAVPLGAGLALVVIPHGLGGIDGWRWLGWFPAIGALAIWWVQRALPESPRWLADHGQAARAEAVLAAIEAKVERETGRSLPGPEPQPPLTDAPATAPASSMWAPPYGRRIAMMSAFHVLQSVGYFGFANWAPTLLEARGVTITKSLAYTAAIALSYPLAPILVSAIADRVERKWQIVIGALGAAACGLLFAGQSSAGPWIALGVLLSVFNILMSIGFHAYQSELFPTHFRARAVGLVYSFSRLSAVVSGYLIAFLLQASGVTAVFAAIAAMLAGAAAIVWFFGPRTRGRALEEISPG
ncbi:MAG: MFS transporter [Caulobacteraceae bacterium]